MGDWVVDANNFYKANLARQDAIRMLPYEQAALALKTKNARDDALRNQYMTEYQTAYDEAQAANEKRYAEALGLNDQVISAYSDGGSYGAGAMKSYERGKTKARATAYAGMVNSGTANLISGSGFDKVYEEEVGTPFRLNLQDRQTEGLTTAYNNKAATIVNRTDSYPDQSLYVQLLQQLGNS